MSTISFDQLMKQVERLSPAEKAVLERMLHASSDTAGKQSGGLSPGWAEGLVMSEDFDAPLDDFKEYIES